MFCLVYSLCLCVMVQRQWACSTAWACRAPRKFSPACRRRRVGERSCPLTAPITATSASSASSTTTSGRTCPASPCLSLWMSRSTSCRGSARSSSTHSCWTSPTALMTPTREWYDPVGFTRMGSVGHSTSYSLDRCYFSSVTLDSVKAHVIGYLTSFQYRVGEKLTRQNLITIELWLLLKPWWKLNRR